MLLTSTTNLGRAALHCEGTSLHEQALVSFGTLFSTEATGICLVSERMHHMSVCRRYMEERGHKRNFSRMRAPSSDHDRSGRSLLSVKRPVATGHHDNTRNSLHLYRRYTAPHRSLPFSSPSKVRLRQASLYFKDGRSDKISIV